MQLRCRRAAQIRQNPSALRSLLLLAALLIAGASDWSSSAHATPAVRLIMVEEAGCRFCARWDAEVGRIYAGTAEGRFAPLQRVRRDASELSGLKPATYTPTFILMRGESEVGRITGYPGETYFWEELGELLAGAGYATLPQSTARSD